MPGGVKLHRVFFCRLRNREAWLEGSDLLILKRDRQPPRVVMDFERFTRLLRWTLAEHYDYETCRDVPLSRLYGFGKPTNVSEITYKLTTDIILHYFKG